MGALADDIEIKKSHIFLLNSYFNLIARPIKITVLVPALDDIEIKK
jgi:hypothetical protein